MEHLDALTPDNNSRFQHMQDRVYRSEHSVPVEPLTDVGTGDVSEDMVSVAVEIKIDTLNNSKVSGSLCTYLSYYWWIQQTMGINGAQQMSHVVPGAHQQRPETPTVSVTLLASKYEVCKFNQRYFFFLGICFFNI